MQLMTLTTKGQVTIPQDIRMYLGLKSGDQVLFEKNNKTIEVRPAPNFFSFRGALIGSKRINNNQIKAIVAKNLAKRYRSTLSK